jgi:hypothetical protein
MTASSPDWDPGSPNFAVQEESMRDDYGEVRDLSETQKSRAPGKYNAGPNVDAHVRQYGNSTS